MTRGRVPFVALLMLVALGASLMAQAPVAGSATPSFEVASVKPNRSNAPPAGLVGGQRNGLTLTNLTVRELIVKAYKLQNFQLSGGPGWIHSERFDVVARTVRESTVDEKWQMLQVLLNDRFQLEVHAETRVRQGYTLVMARKDRKFGPSLRQSPAPCGVGAAMPCGGLAIGRFGDLSARSLPMTDFAGRALTFILGQTVRDGTGLTGNYDIDLKWRPETAGLPPSGASRDQPSIFAAVQEQLGLKLDPQKGPVRVLVIDHVERPSAD